MSHAEPDDAQSATPSEDPWTVLGITPTQDVRAVKAAYFERLKTASPHANPEGFRRLRRAYEALLAPGALASAAWATAPDLDSLRATLAREFHAAEQRAEQSVASDAARSSAARSFVERYGALSWDESVARANAAGERGE